jgi:hypothetical protein
VVSAVDFSRTASDVASQDATDTSPEAFTELCKLVRDVDFGHDMLASYPSDRAWALRNISNKLYVRSDGIPILNIQDNFTYEGHRGLQASPGLGHVLLTNILWSDGNSTSMRFSDVQGGWAGDRIDVRLMDDVVEEMQEEGWKDVSRQEAIRLYEILVEEGVVEGDLPEEPKASL